MTGQSQRPRAGVAQRTDPLAVETKLFRGLADPARLRILLALRAGPMAPGEIAAQLVLTPSNASNHLLCLLECGLVSVESRGRHNVYGLADPAVDRLLDAGAMLLDVIGPAIEECINYGPPSRRALRSAAGDRKPDRVPSPAISPGWRRQLAQRVRTSPRPKGRVT